MFLKDNYIFTFIKQQSKRTNPGLVDPDLCSVHLDVSALFHGAGDDSKLLILLTNQQMNNSVVPSSIFAYSF